MARKARRAIWKEITVNRAKRLVVVGVGLGVTLGVALLASVALGGGSALAQGTESMELQLTPSRDSGVSGTAILTDAEGGVRVELNMRGLPEAGIEHINHFHAGGTCTDDRAGNPAPATIPLKTIVAKGDGTGSATTTLEDVTLKQLFDPDKKRYIALHARTEEGQGVPPVISCADVVEAAGSGAVSTKLPESGGMHPVLFFSVVGILILGTISGLFAWRRGTLPRPRVD
jgi:Cu/Zn superoxide dismutase